MQVLWVISNLALVGFAILLGSGCIIVAGVAAVGGTAAYKHSHSTDFTPYIGQQLDWPTAPGALVKTNYAVAIYYNWPAKPYNLLGVIVARDIAIKQAAQTAKKQGGDALIFRLEETEHRGSVTTSTAQASNFGTIAVANGQSITVPIEIKEASFWVIKFNAQGSTNSVNDSVSTNRPSPQL